MTVVTDFFDAYQRRRRQRWGELDELRLALEDPGVRGLYEAQALRPPVLTHARVAAILAAAGLDPTDARSYCELVSTWSWHDLDLEGWIDFPKSASEEQWSRHLGAMRACVDADRFFPFASDLAAGGSVLFCLDRVPKSDGEPVISIVDEGRIVERVFSSFDALLGVSTHLLESEVVLHVPRGQEPDEAQQRLVAELRRIDPEGFGAVGWPRWYQRKVGGTAWG